MENVLNKIIPKIAIPVIVVAALLIVFVVVDGSRKTSEENNAYIRVINCIVSQNAKDRAQSDIEQCYITVENDLGIELTRYDSSKQ